MKNRPRKGSKTFTLQAAFSLATIVCCSTGCVEVLRVPVLSAYPTYEQTEQKWAPVPADRGRLIVYYPRISRIVGPYGEVTVKIDGGKDGRETPVGDQTFVFIDLTSGTHEIYFTDGKLFASKWNSTLDIHGGETIYLKVVNTEFKSYPPMAVKAEDARADLIKNMRHNYKKAVPFDDLKHRGMPAL